MSFDRYDQGDELQEFHERRITRCKSTGCRAQIIWFKTAAGKNMPVDADSVKPEDAEYDPERHVSHWATCPASAQFRGKRNQP